MKLVYIGSKRRDGSLPKIQTGPKTFVELSGDGVITVDDAALSQTLLDSGNFKASGTTIPDQPVSEQAPETQAKPETAEPEQANVAPQPDKDALLEEARAMGIKGVNKNWGVAKLQGLIDKVKAGE